MLRKLHKLREEFPFELSSSAPDTRHGLFERQPRQLETELFNIQRRFQEESSQLEQALLSDVAITQASAVDSMLASRQYCVQTRMASSWIWDPGKIPSSVL